MRGTAGRGLSLRPGRSARPRRRDRLRPDAPRRKGAPLGIRRLHRRRLRHPAGHPSARRDRRRCRLLRNGGAGHPRPGSPRRVHAAASGTRPAHPRLEGRAARGGFRRPRRQPADRAGQPRRRRLAGARPRRSDGRDGDRGASLVGPRRARRRRSCRLVAADAGIPQDRQRFLAAAPGRDEPLEPGRPPQRHAPRRSAPALAEPAGRAGDRRRLDRFASGDRRSHRRRHDTRRRCRRAARPGSHHDRGALAAGRRRAGRRRPLAHGRCRHARASPIRSLSAARKARPRARRRRRPRDAAPCAGRAQPPPVARAPADARDAGVGRGESRRRGRDAVGARRRRPDRGPQRTRGGPGGCRRDAACAGGRPRRMPGGAGHAGPGPCPARGDRAQAFRDRGGRFRRYAARHHASGRAARASGRGRAAARRPGGAARAPQASARAVRPAGRHGPAGGARPGTGGAARRHRRSGRVHPVGIRRKTAGRGGRRPSSPAMAHPHRRCRPRACSGSRVSRRERGAAHLRPVPEEGCSSRPNGTDGRFPGLRLGPCDGRGAGGGSARRGRTISTISGAPRPARNSPTCCPA